MKKMSEQELTAETIKASNHYLKATQQEGLGMVDKNRVVNSVAAGFWMGVRWYENKLEMAEKNATDKNLN